MSDIPGKMFGREVTLPTCPKCGKNTVATNVHACLNRDCDWKDPAHWPAKPMPTPPDRNRKLVAKWLNMPLHVKIGIVKGLNVYKDGDTQLTDAELLKQTVQRAGGEQTLAAIEDYVK